MTLRGVLTVAASAAVLSLAAAGASHASATAGSIWINQASNSAATIPGTTPDATFTPGAINYNPLDTNPPYTIGAFLNNPTFSNVSAAFTDAGGANTSFGFGTGNTFIDITGTVGLLAGNNTFNVEHDDGVVLTITGFGVVVNDPGPTAAVNSPFTVDNTGAAGNFAFNLQYVECCGPPAKLVWTINDVTVGGGVPEPASWALMIVGMAGLGGALRLSRRREASLATV